MTKNRIKKGAAVTLEIASEPGEKQAKTLARVSLAPGVRHAQAATAFASRLFGKDCQPSIMDSTEALADMLKEAEAGGKSTSSRMLAAQAVVLDTLFTNLAARSHDNMGQYLDASERYMRLALRAQSNCRATLEALGKLHQPREQTVKHVQVNEGGQAIVADHIHQQGGQNEKSDKQSHATEAAGESASLLGHDAQGNGVPIASGAKQAAMQDARRD
ncbi:MAG: hypothetical protein ABJP34_03555 [Erythrobacter sp.]